MARRVVNVVDRFYTRPFESLNLSTAGISLRSQTIDTGVRNLIPIVIGQSNAACVGPTAFSPVNGSALDQLSIYDGAVRVASDPLIGPSYPRTAGVPIYGPGSWALRLADSFITAALFDRVILVPAGVGATRVSDWEAGGICGNVIPVIFRRLSSLGMTAGTNVTVCVLWCHGESDTDAGTGQAAYTNSLNSVIAASRTEGFTGPWFIAKESRSTGTTSASVTAAQAAVVNHSASVWAGPDLDALNGANCSGSACRQGDDTHFSNNGMASAAAAWKAAMALYGTPFV